MSPKSHPVRTKRIYEESADDDGFRVLIDRLWPRGVAKTDAHVDLWLKDVAPSNELRKWFDHDPAKWPEFQQRYAKELAAHKDALRDLLTRAAAGPVTLLYAAKDTEHNNAVALQAYLAKLKRA